MPNETRLNNNNHAHAIVEIQKILYSYYRAAKEVTMTVASHSELKKMLAGHRLVTAHILYRMPDHQHLLQEFIWQNLDLMPKLPVLNKFLAFWQTSIDGKLHEVRVACAGLVLPSDLKFHKGQNTLTLQ